MARKKLIVVYDKNTEATANYLLQLISGNDDAEGTQVGTKDGNVEVSLWSEKEYNDSRPKMSSTQYVLFVGNGKMVKTLRENVTDTFCAVGMHYGWLGTQAFMYVDGGLNKDNIDEFNALCDKYAKQFEAKLDMHYSPSSKNILKVVKRVGDLFQSKEAEKQQYTLLATIMYMDGITKFIGE